MGDLLAALTQRLEVLERTASVLANSSNEFANDEVAVKGQDSQLVNVSGVSGAADGDNAAPPVESQKTSVGKHPPANTPLAGWLSTGELHQELTKRGFDKTGSTLRRWLAAARKTGELPDDLTRLGVRADFELRRAGNPKDNSLRWLRLIHPWELD